MQSAIKLFLMALSIIFVIVSVTIFLPLFGDVSKGFTKTNETNKGLVETTEIPVPIGFPSAEIIASLHDIALQDYAIEVRQGSDSYVFLNDKDTAKNISKLKRNTTFNKAVIRDTEGTIQRVIYQEIAS